MKGKIFRLREIIASYFGISELVLRVRRQSHCQHRQTDLAAQRS